MDVVTNALSALGFDIQVAVANLVNFAIIFFLLNKYLFPNIAKTINERKKMIQDGIDNATKAETRLAQVAEERNQVLALAQDEALALRVEAMKEKHKRMQEADDEAVAMIAKAKHLLALELDNERKNDNAEFARESARAVSQAVEKIILEKFDNPELSARYMSNLLR